MSVTRKILNKQMYNFLLKNFDKREVDRIAVLVRKWDFLSNTKERKNHFDEAEISAINWAIRQITKFECEELMNGVPDSILEILKKSNNSSL